MRIAINLPDETLSDIDRRARRTTGGADRSGVIASDLARYQALLKRTRLQLAERFSGDELSLICDSLNGTISDDQTAFWFGMNIADSIELDGIDKKWGVSRDVLMSKISSLSPAEQLAIVDAAERFWVEVARGEEVNPADILGGPVAVEDLVSVEV